MRNFVITVNGTQYEVAVEEVEAGAAPVAAAPKAAPKAAAKPAAAPKAAAVAGEKVTAPMPGNIVDVKVQVGASVKKGDVLVVLEAMKMENNIDADRGGVVKQVLVQQGATVMEGDVLIVIE